MDVRFIAYNKNPDNDNNTHLLSACRQGSLCDWSPILGGCGVQQSHPSRHARKPRTRCGRQLSSNPGKCARALAPLFSESWC